LLVSVACFGPGWAARQATADGGEEEGETVLGRLLTGVAAERRIVVACAS
jgi:hypothetical protein